MSELDAPTIAIYSIWAFSLMDNVVLLIVYYQCPLPKIKSYKYFFLFAAVHDIALSATFLLLIPRIISRDGFYTVIATGLLASRPTGAMLLILFCVSFLVTTLLVTNSFIYRYLYLLREQWLQKYSTTKIIMLGFIVNTSLLIVYGVTVYEVALPDEDLDGLIRSTVSISGVDMNETSFIGLSTTHSLSIMDLVLCVNSCMIFVLTGGINIFCAKEICAFLKSGVLRFTSLTLQRQMFTLLLLQAACPVLFVQMPFLFTSILFYTGLDTTPLMTNLLDILMALLPLVNPVIIIAFLEDYRNFVFAKLRIKKPSQGSNIRTRSPVADIRNTVLTARATSEAGIP